MKRLVVCQLVSVAVILGGISLLPDRAAGWTLLVLGGICAIAQVLVHYRMKKAWTDSGINMQDCPMSTVFGIIGEAEGGTLLHERVHMFLLAPHMLLATYCLAPSVLILMFGMGLWTAMGLATLACITLRWIHEGIADLVAFVIYRRSYIEQLRHYQEIGDWAYTPLLAKLLLYPPYRLLIR